MSETDRGITVVLDTNLTPELIEEGFVREVISKIQTMRKEADFQVMDHICVYQQGNDTIRDIIEKNADQIKEEVLADEICLDRMDGHTASWKINGEEVTLGVSKSNILVIFDILRKKRYLQTNSMTFVDERRKKE